MIIKNKILLISLFSLFFSPFVSADTCPTVSDIKDRKVPESYEWTVNYEPALDDLLSVRDYILSALKTTASLSPVSMKAL